MTRIVAGLLTFLFLTTVSLGASKAKTFIGEIMDSRCAMSGSHARMERMYRVNSKTCTLGCTKMGAKFVLYDGAAKRTYQLDDQNPPKEFAGEKVKITGTFDKATSTIHVEKIELSLPSR